MIKRALGYERRSKRLRERERVVFEEAERNIDGGIGRVLRQEKGGKRAGTDGGRGTRAGVLSLLLLLLAGQIPSATPF